MYFLGGGNSNIFLFSPLFGEDSQFDYEYFSNGLVQPPTGISLSKPTWKDDPFLTDALNDSRSLAPGPAAI